MFANPGKLSKKIVGILVAFFLVAMTAIGLTLLISWQLEGVAAAINDAGSQRMRTYRIGHLMARGVDKKTSTIDLEVVLKAELDQFDKVLRDLQLGDPMRPLSPPRNGEVQDQLNVVGQAWGGRVRPLVVRYLADQPQQREATVDLFDNEIEGFVSSINELVLAMERSYTHDTNLLRTVQAALIFLAIFGTGILIRFFIRLVITPVAILLAGMRRMTGNNLSVRLPTSSNDELGSLAQGFNQMAENLQNAYSTLEQRVEEETRSLAQRNRELGILYEETAFLTQPSNLENLCQGFLSRIKTGAGGGWRCCPALRRRQGNLVSDGA